jgi:hypothetical protein
MTEINREPSIKAVRPIGDLEHLEMKRKNERQHLLKILRGTVRLSVSVSFCILGVSRKVSMFNRNYFSSTRWG